MKTPVEWLRKEFEEIPNYSAFYTNNYQWVDSIINEAKEKETELLLHVIKCYHNNLFFVPLNENGEAEAILELILSGQIKSKLDI
jgi:hypothetical protein